MLAGRIFGIKVRLNNLFLLLLFGYLLLGILPQGLMVFGVVLLHELAHVITAKFYKMKVVEIELLPFGGVARIDDSLEVDSTLEKKVALAGPLLNILLIIITLGLYPFSGGFKPYLLFFMEVNLLLAGFNLLPALPLDGGRLYRAYLVPRVGFKKATEKAAGAGKIFSVFFAVFGLLGMFIGLTDLNIFIISLFLYRAAAREKESAMYIFMKYLNRKQGDLNRKRIMRVRKIAALENVEVKEVTRYFVPKRFHQVAVIDRDGRYLGVLMEKEIIEGMFKYGINITIGEILQKKE